jgi:D-alanyl-D-alanine carboxypeptidase/D-alanyl-D-alanine-endopeptidase (penicillin-binding protein 4)
MLGAVSEAPAGTPPLNRYLMGILSQEVPPNVAVSIQVADLESGKILMERNADTPLVPASTMKVVTSAAALQVLNPDFTFVTDVLAEGLKSASAGTLFLKGYGDPYLVNEELFALTRSVRERGLQEVRGNIVVDDSYFLPEPPLDENEKLGARSYHAPYSALSLNFNSIKVTVTPGSRPGKPATVTLDPESGYASVKGTVKTVAGDRSGSVSISKEPRPDGGEFIVVQGEIGSNATPKGRYVNVTHPSLYTGEVFKAFLAKEGVKVEGRVVRGTVPSTAASYYEFHSRPLGSIVYWLNKFSNNFMAEQIGMTMGAAVYGAPGTREKGLAVIRRYLQSCGVNESCYSLSEASGLSRHNRLSASALVRVLLEAHRDFAYNAEFEASLGVAGADGTLKEKFSEPALRRKIRGKTGTLRGVNALTGYAVSKDGRRFAFAVIANSLDKGNGFIHCADKIARQLVDVPMNAGQ